MRTSEHVIGSGLQVAGWNKSVPNPIIPIMQCSTLLVSFLRVFNRRSALTLLSQVQVVTGKVASRTSTLEIPRQSFRKVGCVRPLRP